MIEPALASRARAAGIEMSHRDGFGIEHALDEQTCRALLGAIDAVPDHARAWVSPALEAGARLWGVSVQLWSVRSARNWGIGDFSDLARLCAIVAAAGGAFVGINPLHARVLTPEVEPSPYAPSARQFLDPLSIDVEAIEGFASCEALRVLTADSQFQQRIERVRSAARVDYAEVASLKLTALALLYEAFCRSVTSCARFHEAAAFHQFTRDMGPSLQRFAQAEALRGAHASVAALAQAGFHAWMQWHAHHQLQRAAHAALAAGMPIGLYRDLAVGAREDGAERDIEPGLCARGVHVGAPPDAFNRLGQNWGLSPWNPQELARRSYGPFRELVRANMQYAGALRIDHVMSLMRLYWIPVGREARDGGYVRQHFEALAAIVSAESRRNRCMVIGEDLGAVPEGFRERLERMRWLSSRVLFFERDWQGDRAWLPPAAYPVVALSSVGTHDLPGISDWWRGGDIRRRAALGLVADLTAAEAERVADRIGIVRLIDALALPGGAGDGEQSVIDGLHRTIAATPSWMVAVQLDDVLEETEPVNVPGTGREQANWTRRLSLPLEALADDPRFRRLARIMSARAA